MFEVSDIFGDKVKGVRVSLTRPDGYGEPSDHSRQDGTLDLPPNTWSDARLYCGDFACPVSQIQEGVPLRIPGKSSGLFGELAVLPLGWDELRISLKDQMSWKQSQVADETLGHRFLYLHPGTYQIGDRPGSRELATVEVVSGQRTTFVVTGWSGLKLNLSFIKEPDTLPSKLLVHVKGLSSGASFLSRSGFSLEVKSGQRTYTHYPVNPGTYHVFVEGEHEFSDYVQLVDGKVGAVEVRLRKK